MTEDARLCSRARRPVRSAATQVDEAVEDPGRLVGGLDLEPDGLGEKFEAKLEEAAAGLLPPSEVRGGEQGIAAVFKVHASRAGAPGDLDDPKVHELSPLLDPSAGVVRGSEQAIGTRTTQPGYRRMGKRCDGEGQAVDS